jgi:hypothetical protein
MALPITEHVVKTARHTSFYLAFATRLNGSRGALIRHAPPATGAVRPLSEAQGAKADDDLEQQLKFTTTACRKLTAAPTGAARPRASFPPAMPPSVSAIAPHMRSRMDCSATNAGAPGRSGS